ncbi:NAD(P)H-hydrate dehydratase [Mycetocola tolaasinivorans]|uniref:ADP-dependent (S)-NAD(P)H-hydrate dehydratase n=1 Tax=Mycetocola tolaasinivorans TaxID=76635 RepID=A0A3L7A2A4_9MICO|nr:ADP/ATP-dependent (S)-NAD(P)H-hydrate dehydratase [Mycetocola tolaasinivorans]RLP74138.1 NAD(P)H-hydrate dehydratase [Mycetocola tolaasinivorans]
MSTPPPLPDWTIADTRRAIRVPTARDDKYRRGVLGIRTGSALYPGAAVLSVEAALHTGVGMVRYLGSSEAAGYVLARRPEAVTAPGRIQALLLGSGMASVDPDGEDARAFASALAAGIPGVLDAGALHLVTTLPTANVPSAGPVLITPHAGELARLLTEAHEPFPAIPESPDAARAWIEDHPAQAGTLAAERWGATVLVKGAHTVIVTPHGAVTRLPPATAWLATAGTGDVLAGVIAALVAGAEATRSEDSGRGTPLTHDALAHAAAAGAHLHALAAERASAGGPLLALDLARALAPTVARVLEPGA